MLYESRVKLLGDAPKFPDYTGERVYMEPIYKGSKLPSELKRWDGFLGEVLEYIDVHPRQPLYLMIDQQFVKANSYHRRGGMHIDGYWHAGGHGGHSSGGHVNRPRGGHSYGHWGYTPPPDRKPTKKKTQAIVGWGDSAFEEPEAIILATNIEATMAYKGVFAGPIGDGGDCSDIRPWHRELEEVWLEAGNVYAGNVTMLHQTHPVPVDCYRTVVRINAPGWTV